MLVLIFFILVFFLVLQLRLSAIYQLLQFRLNFNLAILLFRLLFRLFRRSLIFHYASANKQMNTEDLEKIHAKYIELIHTVAVSSSYKLLYAMSRCCFDGEIFMLNGVDFVDPLRTD